MTFDLEVDELLLLEGDKLLGTMDQALSRDSWLKTRKGGTATGSTNATALRGPVRRSHGTPTSS